MDATAHLHMRLGFNINSPRDFNCFNFQLVVSLHISTGEKCYDVKYE